MVTTLTGPPINRDRYAIALENIHKARPRVDVDTWTEHDAAKYWFPQHDPMDSMGLPSPLVMALVARLFAAFYWDHPLLRRLFIKMRDDGDSMIDGACPSPSHNVSFNMSKFCSLVHASRWGFAEPEPRSGQSRSDAVTWIYRSRWLRDNDSPYIGYCGRKTCSYRHSVLRGCLPQEYYEAMDRQRWWRPWSSVQWTGLSTVLTPLRNSLETPYISVRKERSHVRKAVVPFDTADLLNNLHQIVPALLMASDCRQFVAERLQYYLDSILSQRLRYSAIVSLSGDLSARLHKWGWTFTRACWNWQQAPADSIYDSGTAWDVDYSTWRQLYDNTPADLFPVLPADSSSDS